MTYKSHRQRLIAIALAATVATTSLSGCATTGGGNGYASANRAEKMLEKGKPDKAITYAERAVMAEPRNPAYRAILGNAYLGAGRFDSAATSFDDAMALGDTSARTALSLALAYTAAGEQREAVAVLDDWRDEIAPADLGLAYALAGEADRGVHVLSDELRSGENTPKVRQNLAYAYALGGYWQQARIMASKDVPFDQLEPRINKWAQAMHAGGERQRVAALLHVPVSNEDPGQPSELALSNFPSAEQLAAQAAAYQGDIQTAAADVPAVPMGAEPVELPPQAEYSEPSLTLARYDTPLTTPPQDFEAEFAASVPKGGTPAAVIGDTARFITDPVVQKLPAQYASPSPAKAKSTVGRADGTHLVQLGSFLSEPLARKAWGVFANRHAGLSGHEMEISRAEVGGKRYWRVSATGFDKAGAQSICNDVRKSGGGCIPYAVGKPLPGAID